MDLQINSVDMVSEHYFEMFYNAIYNGLIVISGLYALFILYPPLAYGTIAIIIMSLLMIRTTENTMEKVNDELVDANNNFVNKVVDLLSGFFTIKVNALQNYFSNKSQEFIKDYEKKRFSYKIKSMFLGDITYLPTLLLYYGLLILIGFEVLRGNIKIGVILGFLNIHDLVVSSSEALSNNILSMVAAKSIIKDDEINTSKDAAKNDNSNFEIKNSISVDNLKFSYDSNVVFNNFSTKFDIGEKYIIAGESGCGKSTLLKLIAKQISINDNMIYYDDVPAGTVDEESFYNQIAYISQESYIYSNTIFYNIFFDSNPDKEFVRQVLCESGLDEFINTLDDGLETMIIENGTNLSGGQKQRIAIARALAQKKKILFMDEPTRSLDNEMALRIEKNLFSDKELTIIMITHSLKERIINICDKIINL